MNEALPRSLLFPSLAERTCNSCPRWRITSTALKITEPLHTLTLASPHRPHLGPPPNQTDKGSC